MQKFILVPLTLLVALGARGTTLSDNLTGTTLGTEQVNGTTWITAGFRTDSSSYTLQSATFLMQQDSPGTLNVSLYSSSPGNQPGTPLGSLTAISSYPSSLGDVTFGGNHLRLAAETTFWLVMSAPASGSYEWAYPAGSTGSGVGFYPSWGISTDSGGSWVIENLQPMQMRVIGAPVSATPEPATTGLALLGAVTLLGAGASRFRGLTISQFGGHHGKVTR